MAKTYTRKIESKNELLGFMCDLALLAEKSICITPKIAKSFWSMYHSAKSVDLDEIDKIKKSIENYKDWEKYLESQSNRYAIEFKCCFPKGKVWKSKAKNQWYFYFNN